MFEGLKLEQKRLTTKPCPVVFPEMKSGIKVKIGGKSCAESLREKFFLVNLKERKLFDHRDTLTKSSYAIEERKTREQVYTEIVNEYQTEIDKGIAIAKKTKAMDLLSARSAPSLFDIICENTDASSNKEFTIQS